MAKSKTDPTTKKADGEQPARRRAPARPRTTTKSPAAAATPQQPTNEAIASLAYELYIRRGRAHGSHVEDWLEAERILKNRS